MKVPFCLMLKLKLPVPPDVQYYSEIQISLSVALICNPSFCIIRICNPVNSSYQTNATSGNPLALSLSIAGLYK